jgi:BlaI family penicillinase repressor
MDKKISLSDSEWKLMQCLWRESPRTITQLVEALKTGTAWSKHTVISMLSRLEAKGAIYYREGARAKQYYPAVPKKEIAAAETESFLSKVYGGSLSMMLNSWVEQKALSKEEIGELYKILERAKKEASK